VKERAWKIQGKHRMVESRDAMQRQGIFLMEVISLQPLLHQICPQSSLHTSTFLLNLSARQPKHTPLQRYALANRTWLLLHASDFSLPRHKGLVRIHRWSKEPCHRFSDLLVRRSSQPRYQAGFSGLPPIVSPSASGIANPSSYLCCPLSLRYTRWMLNA